MKAGGRKPGLKMGGFRPKRESWNLCFSDVETEESVPEVSGYRYFYV